MPAVPRFRSRQRSVSTLICAYALHRPSTCLFNEPFNAVSIIVRQAQAPANLAGDVEADVFVMIKGESIAVVSHGARLAHIMQECCECEREIRSAAASSNASR